MVYQISSLQQGLASEGGRAGAASAWLPRAGSRSAGGGRYRARGARRLRRALATLRPRTPHGRRYGNSHVRGGGRWSRHARLRAPPMPLRTDTFAAGAGHATPAYAPRTPLRKTDALAAADAGPHYAPRKLTCPRRRALATNGHYAGGGSARAVRWSLPRGVRGRAGSR